jgi:hypothetical protein
VGEVLFSLVQLILTKSAQQKLPSGHLTAVWAKPVAVGLFWLRLEWHYSHHSHQSQRLEEQQVIFWQISARHPTHHHHHLWLQLWEEREVWQQCPCLAQPELWEPLVQQALLEPWATSYQTQELMQEQRKNHFHASLPMRAVAGFSWQPMQQRHLHWWLPWERRVQQAAFGQVSGHHHPNHRRRVWQEFWGGRAVW